MGAQAWKGTLGAAGLLLVLLGGGALGAAPAGPGANYTAALSGGEEVPPRTTPASGTATFQVSPDGQALTYTVTVSNLTNVTAGHIHLGAKGANGDIVLPLVPTAPAGGGLKNGVIGQGTATAAQLIGPLQGKSMADLVAQMDAGNAYVNLHTASGASPATQQPGDIPPGEIRGQIAVVAAAPGGATATVRPAAPSAMPTTGGGFAAPTWPRAVLPAALLVALLAATAGVGYAARRGGGRA